MFFYHDWVLWSALNQSIMSAILKVIKKNSKDLGRRKIVAHMNLHRLHMSREGGTVIRKSE